MKLACVSDVREEARRRGALGANAVLLGRAYAYGLAANGTVGVSEVLRMIARELDVSLALMGVGNIAELRQNAPEIAYRRSR
jgi:isopentenyl diphosphate isomerase/L-lactate dehydrogenase-like FMN-dependent dehydrogenase